MALGGLLGVVFLWWIFRGTDWGEVRGALRNVDWRWVAVSHLVLWTTHLARVERWRYVVAAVRPTPFRSLLAAAQSGTLMNLVLPLRLGDAVRMMILARLGRFGIPKAAAMVALDRLAELLGLLTVFAFMLLGFPMDRDLTLPPGTIGNAEPLVFLSTWVRSAVLTSGALFVCVGLALGAIYVSRGRWRSLTFRAKPIATLHRMLVGFSEGLEVLRSGGALFGSYGFTVVAWALNAISLAVLMSAFQIEYPWYSPLVLLVLLAAFIVAPITPGLVGQFHLPLIAGLLLTTVGTTLAEAKAFALVAHVANTIPIVALGIYGLAISGLGWRGLWTGLAESDEVVVASVASASPEDEEGPRLG